VNRSSYDLVIVMEGNVIYILDAGDKMSKPVLLKQGKAIEV